MTPEEFIRKNLISEMVRSGLQESSAESFADEGVRYWREAARFKKSAWQDTLAYVKNRAKKIKLCTTSSET